MTDVTDAADAAAGPTAAADDFAEAVRRAAEAWRWLPYDAQQVEVAGQPLIIRDHEARIHVTEPPDAALVTAVHRRAAAGGAGAVTWVVASSERSTAPACPAVLADAGAVCVEDLQLAASPLPVPAPWSAEPPAGLRVRRVDTEQLLDRAYDLDAEVFGTPPRSAEYRREAAATLRAQLARERDAGVVADGPCRFVVLADGGGAPTQEIGLVVASAGVTVVDAVARLWGAAVLPSYRGRGLFGVLLAAVLGRATAAGATMALARARVDNTAGMLRRAGFGGYGWERHYRIVI